ncbi:MAG: hypothetical protein WA057_02180 [Candidatus Magasanikiibacteriota bacterium]
MDGKFSYLQKRYAEEEGIVWYEERLKNRPDYPQQLFDTLNNSGIIPKGNKLDGFVFASISANRADMEAEFASVLDKEVKDEEFIHPPKVVAMDLLGKKENEREDGSYDRFVSGIQPKKLPNLKNVEFSRISADANNLPLTESGVDVIFDKLGLIWHSLNDETGHIQFNADLEVLRKKILEILEKLSEILKVNGKIVVDAFEVGVHKYEETGCATSTADCLEQVGVLKSSSLLELGKLGLQIKFIGEGKDKLLVFEKIDNKN